MGGYAQWHTFINNDTILFPPQTFLPTENQIYKYICQRGSFSFKTPQGIYWNFDEGYKLEEVPALFDSSVPSWKLLNYSEHHLSFLPTENENRINYKLSNNEWS